MKIFIIAALTVDGFIGQDASHLSTKWSTKADKALFMQKTKEAGVILCGRTTFDTFNRALPGRRTLVYTSRPDSITAEGVEPVNGTPQDIIAKLQAEGVEALAICGGAQVYHEFLAAGLVNELYLTVHPTVFGTGIPLFRGAVTASLKLIEAKEIGDDTVMLHYSVI